MTTWNELMKDMVQACDISDDTSAKRKRFVASVLMCLPFVAFILGSICAVYAVAPSRATEYKLIEPATVTIEFEGKAKQITIPKGAKITVTIPAKRKKKTPIAGGPVT